MQSQGVVRTGAREIQKNKQKYNVKYKINQPDTDTFYKTVATISIRLG
jgi:hypothetical protein